VNGPWLTGSHGGNRHNNPWATFGKTTDFVKTSPSDVFMMVDESPWSINDGGLAVSAAVPEWVDYPSTLHNNGCGFSFCDGHAEMHNCRGTSLVLHAEAGTKGVAAGYLDWIWVWTHSSIKMQ